MRCWKCGNDLPEGQKFCQACGADQRQPSAQPPQAPYPPGPQNTAPEGAFVRSDRSLMVYILLSLVTCGIYSYIFLYHLSKDVNIVCDGDGKTTPGLGKLILLTFVTCGIYSYIFWYNLGNRLASNAPRYGLQFQENGTTVLLWMTLGSLLCGIGPFIGLNIVINNTNALAEAYDRWSANT